MLKIYEKYSPMIITSVSNKKEDIGFPVIQC